MLANILSVKQLNLYVRSLIEGDARLINVSVKGEISNFKNHYGSGHWYFTLKDNDAAIKCVMFKSAASLVKFRPEDGMQVVLRGRVSLYEKDGQYQFYCEQMLPDGIGELALKFEQTKKRLESEGLFDTDSKRELPKFPKKIAVITSPTGAAVQDIFNILSRRWPIAEVMLYPVAVQGELAVSQMISALDVCYSDAEADVIIIGRGGGSQEDLSAFNDETLARMVYESPVPVISAVGHETDFCICDFVADLRAPTPSAAAELAVPDITEINDLLERYSSALKAGLSAKLDISRARFEKCAMSAFFKRPYEYIVENRSLLIDRLSDRLNGLTISVIESAKTRFAGCAATLDALSPLKVLSRGFASVSVDGKSVSSVGDLAVDSQLNVRLADGSAECKVERIIKE